MKLIFRFSVYASFLASAFLIGYRLTETWFEWHLVPYPFQLYGIAVGSALLFWSFTLLQLAELLISKFFVRKKTAKPYIVKSENTVNEVELFK